jgi:hypothetical protein
VKLHPNESEQQCGSNTAALRLNATFLATSTGNTDPEQCTDSQLFVHR